MNGPPSPKTAPFPFSLHTEYRPGRFYECCFSEQNRARFDIRNFTFLCFPFVKVRKSLHDKGKIQKSDISNIKSCPILFRETALVARDSDFGYILHLCTNWILSIWGSSGHFGVHHWGSCEPQSWDFGVHHHFGVHHWGLWLLWTPILILGHTKKLWWEVHISWLSTQK